jgi:hypothetical protein
MTLLLSNSPGGTPGGRRYVTRSSGNMGSASGRVAVWVVIVDAVKYRPTPGVSRSKGSDYDPSLSLSRVLSPSTSESFRRQLTPLPPTSLPSTIMKWLFVRASSCCRLCRKDPRHLQRQIPPRPSIPSIANCTPASPKMQEPIPPPKPASGI